MITFYRIVFITKLRSRRLVTKKEEKKAFCKSTHKTKYPSQLFQAESPFDLGLLSIKIGLFACEGKLNI